MSTVKQTRELTEYYIKAYKKRYAFPPKLNAYKARWQFDTMLNHLSMDEIKKLLDYYFLTVSHNSHDLEWFFWNYDGLTESLTIQERDKAELEIIRKRTEQRVKERRKQFEN